MYYLALDIACTKIAQYQYHIVQCVWQCTSWRFLFILQYVQYVLYRVWRTLLCCQWIFWVTTAVATSDRSLTVTSLWPFQCTHVVTTEHCAVRAVQTDWQQHKAAKSWYVQHCTPQQEDVSLSQHGTNPSVQSEHRFSVTVHNALRNSTSTILPHNSIVSPDAVSALHNSLQQFCLWTVSFACPTASSEGAWDPVTSQARPVGQNRKTCEGAVLGRGVGG